MPFFLRLLSGVLLTVALSSSLFAATVSNKASRTIWHPTYHGERLAYCSLDGKCCGKVVADHYCQILGYEYSTQSVIAYNLGLTRFISTKAQCKGWKCNGFMAIGCATGSKHRNPKPYHYTEKKYVYPRFNQFRVDWCYNQNHDCGAMAANSFCSRMGYMRAVNYVQDKQVATTKSIGSQELCFGNECKSFSEIICSR